MARRLSNHAVVRLLDLSGDTLSFLEVRALKEVSGLHSGIPAGQSAAGTAMNVHDELVKLVT
ncbi:hypothetical protein PG990_000166 [Apiospora arundinis]